MYSMEQIPSCKVKTVARQHKLPAFMELESSLRVHKSTPTVLCLKPTEFNRQSHYKVLRLILFSYSHLHLFLPSNIFPSDFKAELCTHLSHACYMPHILPSLTA